MSENTQPTPEKDADEILALQETPSAEEDVQAHSEGGAISTLSAVADCRSQVS
jgi:hypothetical protein